MVYKYSRDKQHVPLTIRQLHPDENREQPNEPDYKIIDANTFI